MTHRPMDDPRDGPTGSRRVYVYRGTLPPALGLLVLAPLALVFLSAAAALLAGGTVAALVLPLFFRGKRLRRTESDAITLEPDQYARVESAPKELPPR